MHTCKATASNRLASTGTATSFETLLPSIQRIVSFAFRRVQRAQRTELIAAAVARAYEMYVRLVERGKASLVYATALANYAIKQVRSGPSTGSKQNVRAVAMGSAAKMLLGHLADLRVPRGVP